MKKMMLLDTKVKGENLILCFKNSDNFNIINEDQFVCDVPLKSAIQIYNSFSNLIKIDNDVSNYLVEQLLIGGKK